MAVIEKAKTCGGHNLSGAVMRPGPLQELFPELSREDWRKEHFAFGEVTKESVYMLTSAKTKLPVPIPFVPNFKNHGNEVVSVAALARYQARMAEEGGAYILTETSASQLVVEDGKRGRACAPATRAAARTASRWATSSPAPTSRPRSRCWPRAAGAISPAPRSRSSSSPTVASPRSGSSASRRSGRSPSRWTASSTPSRSRGR